MDGAKALILGVTFKENCPDVRNSRVIDIYEELTQFGLLVDIYDPWADKSIVKKNMGLIYPRICIARFMMPSFWLLHIMSF